MKETNEGFTPKPRLVARGFEEGNQDEIVKESPTCSKDSLPMISAITAQKGWDLRSTDIKTASLQGETLQWNVYLQTHTEAGCSKKTLWRLWKCVYGLSDASVEWYDRVKKFMLSMEGRFLKLIQQYFIGMMVKNSISLLQFM